MDVVTQTEEELGFRIRAKNDVVFVRTDTPRRVTEGGVIIPEKQADFYYGLPKGKICWATVLAKGPKAYLVGVGDRVCFLRLDFAWSWKMEDNSYVGWAREPVILARIAKEDVEDVRRDQTDVRVAGGGQGRKRGLAARRPAF